MHVHSDDYLPHRNRQPANSQQCRRWHAAVQLSRAAKTRNRNAARCDCDAAPLSIPRSLRDADAGVALRCRRCYCYSRSLCGCVCVRWWCYFLTTWDSRVTALSSLTYLCFYSFNLPTCCMGAVVICTLLWFALIFVAFLLESVDWSFGLGWCRCRRFTTSLHTHLQLLLFLLHAGTNANAHKYTHADTHTHTHTQCTERRHRHNNTRCTITT